MKTLCVLLFLASIIGFVCSIVLLIKKKPKAKILLISCIVVFIASLALMPTDGIPAAPASTSEPPASASSVPAPSSESESTHAEPVQEEPAVENPLIDCTIFTSDVYNGFKTEVIGKRAYIIVTKAVLSSVTSEQFTEFTESSVGDSGCDWFSVICDDGTGLCFAGSYSAFAEYGKIDSEGVITEVVGYVSLGENGFEYEPAE